MQKLNSSTKTSRSVNKVISKNSIEKAICEHLLVDVNELYGNAKNHKISQKRALLATYFLRYADIKLSTSAKLFQRTVSTLSRQAEKLNRSPEKYFSLDLLKKIEMDLEAVKIQQDIL